MGTPTPPRSAPHTDVDRDWSVATRYLGGRLFLLLGSFTGVVLFLSFLGAWARAGGFGRLVSVDGPDRLPRFGY